MEWDRGGGENEKQVDKTRMLTIQFLDLKKCNLAITWSEWGRRKEGWSKQRNVRIARRMDGMKEWRESGCNVCEKVATITITHLGNEERKLTFLLSFFTGQKNGIVNNNKKNFSTYFWIQRFEKETGNGSERTEGKKDTEDAIYYWSWRKWIVSGFPFPLISKSNFYGHSLFSSRIPSPLSFSFRNFHSPRVGKHILIVSYS